MHSSHALFQVVFVCSGRPVGLGHGLAFAVVTNQWTVI